MTDSPAVRIPLDPKEQPILDKLLAIRTNLELLKQDRSTYVKSQDIIELYDQVIEQVGDLNQIRTTKRLEQNRGLCLCGEACRSSTIMLTIAQQSTQSWMIASSSYRWRI